MRKSSVASECSRLCLVGSQKVKTEGKSPTKCEKLAYIDRALRLPELTALIPRDSWSNSMRMRTLLPVILALIPVVESDAQSIVCEFTGFVVNLHDPDNMTNNVVAFGDSVVAKLVINPGVSPDNSNPAFTRYNFIPPAYLETKVNGVTWRTDPSTEFFRAMTFDNRPHISGILDRFEISSWGTSDAFPFSMGEITRMGILISDEPTSGNSELLTSEMLPNYIDLSLAGFLNGNVGVRHPTENADAWVFNWRPTGFQVYTIPEPSGSGLLAALVTVAAARRRKRA